MSAPQLKRIGIALIATAVVITIVAAWLLLPRNRYTVYADGQTLSVQGNFATVGEVVTAAGIPLSPNDIVQPAPHSQADPNTAIAVQRAQQIILTTDAGSQTYWTHARTVGDFLAEIQYPTNHTDRIYSDGRQLSFSDIFAAPLGREIEIGNFATLTIHEGGSQRLVRTRETTVGGALYAAGITIYAADATEPSLGSWITGDMEITIHRSKPLTIQVDGRIIQTRSHYDTPLNVLAEAGIGLVGLDYTIPAANEQLQPNAVIQVIRVTEDFRIEDAPIAYESQLQPTDQFEIDQRGLLQAGVPGIKRTRYRIRYENGVLTGETIDGSWVAQEPTPEIVGYGTKIVIRMLETENGPLEYWRKVSMRVTSYMAQTSGKPRGAPGYGITASGRQAGYGVVAIDPRVVPFRSQVYVPNYGVAFAGDTGGGVKGRWIDLGYPDNWDTFVHWTGYTDVYYLTPVPSASKINYLIPTTLP